MPVSIKKNFFNSKWANINRKKHGYFYFLDCTAGEGLINPLLIELKNTAPTEFKYYCNFFLNKCINVNRSFSDAVEFLSIWVEKSPYNLLEKLKNRKLKWFFYRTEYDHDGDKWYFPELLQVFTTLVEKKKTSANEILDYLFETFDFFTMPEIFVREIIGYDRLEWCVQVSPAVFKQALLTKMQEFIENNKLIDIGSRSFKYLNNEIQKIEALKTEKQADPVKLALLSKNNIFKYPIKNIKPTDSLIAVHRTNYNRSNNY